MPRPAKAAAAGDNAGEGAAFNGQVATPSEVKFILTLLANLKAKAEINWDAVAAALGTEKKSASERWRVIRKKFGLNLADDAKDNAGEQAAAAKEKTPPVTKDNDTDADNDEEDASGAAAPAAPATPVPKRGRKAAGTATATPRASTGRKRALTGATPIAAASAADGAAMEASPAKKIKGKAVAATPTKTKIVAKKKDDKKDGAAAAAGTAATAADETNDNSSSPLSSAPETIVGSGNEMEE